MIIIYSSYQESYVGPENILYYGFLMCRFSPVLILFKVTLKSKKFFSIARKLNFIISECDGVTKTVVMKNVHFIVYTLSFRIIAFSYNFSKTKRYFSAFDIVGMTIDFILTGYFDLVFVQFSFLVELIETSIKFVNSRLASMLKSDNLDYDTRSITRSSNKRSKIQRLSDLHNILCDLSEELSSHFSFSLLISIAIIFTEIIMQLYIFLQFLVVANVFSEFFPILIFFSILPLFSLTTHVSAALNEV